MKNNNKQRFSAGPVRPNVKLRPSVKTNKNMA